MGFFWMRKEAGGCEEKRENHKKDLAILEQIKNYFKGVGNISK